MLDSAVADTTGLLATSPHEAPVPVPLEGVKVEARLRDFCSRVTLTQRFRNQEKRPLEVVYVFPLEEGAAVCAFEAVIGDRRVVAEVDEREAAFAKYDDAIAAGHGAYLLDEERPDVFTASLGNLPPGAELLLKVSYVAELAREGDDVRFTLPTTISPRYAPASDREGVGPTPEVTLNPPRDWSVPYGLEVEIGVEMASAIRGIESPTHPLSVELDGTRARVSLGERTTSLDRDLVLKVRTSEPARPRAWLESSESGHGAVLLAFEPPLPDATVDSEVIFVVDRSGSMDGSSIVEARNALQLCLRSLRPGTQFNIVGFGSRFESLFEATRPYDDKSLREASRHVERMDADLGGTEILAPLRSVLEQAPQGDRPRVVFLLTDGQVTNTDDVIALVRRHSDTTRVFTFGIGAGASDQLVKGVARAGRGAAESIAPGERIEGKVLRQLKRALSPAVTEVDVDWGGLKVKQAPHRLPPVFGGDRLLVYGLLEASPHKTEVTLRAKGLPDASSFTLTIDPEAAVGDTLVATLAARTLIRDLEEGNSALHGRRGSLRRGSRADRVKAEIVRLGKEFSLASRETSFVAVEERETPVQDEPVLRRIPLALTRGWGGLIQERASFDLQAHALRMPDPCASAAPAPCAAPPLQRLADMAHRRVAFDADARMAEADAAPAAQRPLDRLVTLQNADGSWELTEDLAAALGRSLDELEETLETISGDSHARRAWATALALAWLEANEPGARDEWELLARKAEEWLAACGARPAEAGDWLDHARQALQQSAV